MEGTRLSTIDPVGLGRRGNEVRPGEAEPCGIRFAMLSKHLEVGIRPARGRELDPSYPNVDRSREEASQKLEERSNVNLQGVYWVVEPPLPFAW